LKNVDKELELFCRLGSAQYMKSKMQTDFLPFYEKYAETFKHKRNRHMQGSFAQFKHFLVQERMSTLRASDMTTDLCEQFQKFLLERFNGKTPGNYFGRFKQMIKAARVKGYFED
jgi:hypothetical protein